MQVSKQTTPLCGSECSDTLKQNKAKQKTSVFHPQLEVVRIKTESRGI